MFSGDEPQDLNKSVLFCLLDGSNFGTAIHPRLGRYHLKIGGAKFVEAEFPILLRDAHINAEEPSIHSITLKSPLFAKLYGLKAIISEVKFDPLSANVKANKPDPISFTSSEGNGRFEVEHVMSEPSELEAGIKATTALHIDLPSPINIVQATKLVSKIEELLSLFCFSVVRATFVGFRVKFENEVDRKKMLPLDRTFRKTRVKFDLSRHEVPIRLTSIDFGKLLTNFLAVYQQLELPLSWLRIVISEQRYLEDKYFYSVRMIEAFYKAFEEKLEDKPSLAKLSRIRDYLMMRGDSQELVEFCDKRIRGVFLGSSSLADIVKDLKARYKDIPAVELLDEKKTRDLRGREAHGSTTRLSSSQLNYMAISYELLCTLFIILCLEKIGVAKESIIERLQVVPGYTSYFNAKWIETTKHHL